MKFSVGWKVCKELEWTGEDDGSDPFSENNSRDDQPKIENTESQDLQNRVKLAQSVDNPAEEAKETAVEEKVIPPVKDDKKKSPPPGELQQDDEGYYNLIHPDGRIFRYKGEIKDGQWHGQGILISEPEGFRYEGQFKKGLPHGNGSASFPDEGTTQACSSRQVLSYTRTVTASFL